LAPKTPFFSERLFAACRAAEFPVYQGINREFFGFFGVAMRQKPEKSKGLIKQAENNREFKAA
jgi:hypothetical protein